MGAHIQNLMEKHSFISTALFAEIELRPMFGVLLVVGNAVIVEPIFPGTQLISWRRNEGPHNRWDLPSVLICMFNSNNI